MTVTFSQVDCDSALSIWLNSLDDLMAANYVLVLFTIRHLRITKKVKNTKIPIYSTALMNADS